MLGRIDEAEQGIHEPKRFDQTNLIGFVCGRFASHPSVSVYKH